MHSLKYQRIVTVKRTERKKIMPTNVIIFFYNDPAENKNNESFRHIDIKRMKKAIRKVFHNKADTKSFSKNSNEHRVTCNICDLKNFQVDRYKCLICNNYDLCAHCFEKRQQSQEHTTGKIIFFSRYAMHYYFPYAFQDT